MKKFISLLLICALLASLSLPVFAAQTVDAYSIIQAEDYTEASCASKLGLSSGNYLETCLDEGGGKTSLTGSATHISNTAMLILAMIPPVVFLHV